jgi:hypothetical protein
MKTKISVEERKYMFSNCKLKPYILREVTRGDSKIVSERYYLCEKHSKA